MKESLMRSHLLVQTDDRKRAALALTSGADCLWLDLENSRSRQKARVLVLDLLQSARPPGPQLYVRASGLQSGELDADLDEVMRGAPAGIVLPKSCCGADVQHLGAKLALREAEYDLTHGSTRIIAIAAQTPAAVFKMGTYVGASPRLAGICWAPGDLLAAIAAKSMPAPDGDLTAPCALARSLTLLAARAAGVAAIDCATDLPSALESECEAARRDGFTGKLARDADEIALINAIFA